MADIISTLPDEVLYHILSFLPTQTAAVTSFLSKRWTSLWLSVPSLYFDDLTFPTSKPYNCFRTFIARTILARDAHLPIRKFRLQCKAPNFELSDSDLNIWVKAATQRGLENLYIKLPIIISNVLSGYSGVFSCKTLVLLKLSKLYVKFSSVDLPKLKTLLLENVGFPKPQYLVELLSGCPILKEMYVCVISYADASNSNNLKLKSLPKLVGVQIFNIGLDIPLKSLCNVQCLHIDKFSGEVPVFPNLTHLRLFFGNHMNWHLALEMLKQCPKLQCLIMMMLANSPYLVWPFPRFVPECLSSELKRCKIIFYNGRSGSHFAKYIMQNSRVLMRMVIQTPRYLNLEDSFQLLKELSSCPRISPNCHLQFVSEQHNREDVVS